MRTPLALGIAVLLLAPAARAEGPFSAGRSSLLDAPPAEPLPMPPAPAREADEHARKPFELAARASLAVPSCRAGDAPGGCDGVADGTALAFTGLYRLTPYVALGPDLSLTRFRYDAARPDATEAAGTGGSIGLLARAYFAERGIVDPYLEAGFGGGWAETGYAADGARWSVTAKGPQTSAGAGIDFWLGSFAKLGPSLTEAWLFPTSVRACSAAGCADRTLAEAGSVTRTTRFTVALTLALGREM